MTPLEWLAGAAGAFGSQVAQGMTGFGGALLLVPMLALLWGTHTAVQVGVCCTLIGGLYMVPSIVRDVRPPLVFAMYLPLVATTWVGTGLVEHLPEVVISWVLAAMVSVFAISLLIRPVQEGVGEADDLPTDARERRRLLTLAAVAGACAGLLNGLIGAAGPPVVVFARRFFVDRFFRAQLTALFLLSNATLIAMLVARGLFEEESVWRALWLVGPLLVGNALGGVLSRRLDRARFSRAVAVLLLLASVALVF